MYSCSSRALKRQQSYIFYAIFCIEGIIYAFSGHFSVADSEGWSKIILLSYMLHCIRNRSLYQYVTNVIMESDELAAD